MYIADLNEEELEISIKVVIVGNGAVGKSSLIQRYCRGVFTKSYKKTIGVDFLEKHLRISSEDVRLMLWDTAGQEEFDAITKAYYRGAQACVIAFSTVDRASFEAVKKWRKKVEDECGTSIPTVLVQNKIDLMHQSVVSQEEVERLSRECRMRVYRTSVKEDINVGNVFQHLAENYVNQVKSAQDAMLGFSNGFNYGASQIGGFPFSYHSRRSSSSIASGSPTSPPSPPHPMLTGPVGIRVVPNNRYYSMQYNHGEHSGSRMGYTTPQEYLSNPMFDSLQSRHRLYWPINDRTITLKPLSSLTKTKGLQHKIHLTGKNSCKVL